MVTRVILIFGFLQKEVLSFLTEIAHNEGELQATYFVRELSDIGIRNKEKFGVTLPPYHTKQNMYNQHCWENGWKVYTRN